MSNRFLFARPRSPATLAARLALLLLPLFFAACEAFPFNNRPTPRPPLNTVTPGPSPTPAVVLPTAPVPLVEDGPWLVGFGPAGWTAINTDGGGWTALDLPAQRGGYALANSGWIAVVDESRFTISLLRLPDSESVRVQPLLSDALAARANEDSGDGRLRWQVEDVYLSLLVDEGRPHWSPDGLSLAFSAALGGASSDLYVYDTQTEALRRLSDGPQQVLPLGWAPDGVWVLYLAVQDFSFDAQGFLSYQSSGLWAATADGNQVQQLSDLSGLEGARLYGWTPQGEAILADWSAGGASGLRRLDPASGRSTALFNGPLAGTAVDPASGAIAYLNAIAGEVFVLAPTGGAAVPVTGLDLEPRGLSWSQGAGRFFAWGPSGTAAISVSGELLQRYSVPSCAAPLASPNGQWLLLPACELGEAQAALVSLDGEPAGPAPLGVWAADSSGVYHLTPGEPAGPLAFSALPEGQPQVIHPDPGIGQVLQLLGAVDSTP